MFGGFHSIPPMAGGSPQPTPRFSSSAQHSSSSPHSRFLLLLCPLPRHRITCPCSVFIVGSQELTLNGLVQVLYATPVPGPLSLGSSSGWGGTRLP